MAKPRTNRVLTLIAAIVCWVAAAIYAWRVFTQSATGRYVIPTIGFTVVGALSMWEAVRSAKKAPKRE